eukprot:tig00020801_g13958.t1
MPGLVPTPAPAGARLGQQVAEALGRLLGVPPARIELQPVRGGFTHAAFAVAGEWSWRTADGSSRPRERRQRVGLFVKANASPFARAAFESEAAVLRCIAATGAVRVPEPLHVGALDDGAGDGVDGAFGIYERLDLSPPSEEAKRRLGASLARLHSAPPPAEARAGAPPELGDRAFGFESDTFLGSTRQPNGWSGCWPSFFVERRLRVQLEALAAARGPLPPALADLAPPFLEAARRVLAEEGDGLGPPRASVVHGDLWFGNVAELSSSGEPAFFDPAGYLGDPEVDLGYMSLFASSFGSACFAAHAAAMPPRPGWERRRRVYRAHHQLSFCVLLGEPYLRSAVAALEGVARM